jgi:hypothetical protein
VAKILRTPKYRPQVIPNKKKPTQEVEAQEEMTQQLSAEEKVF